MVSVKNNEIVNICDEAIREPAIILDTEAGLLLKVGDSSWIDHYYNTMLDAFKILGNDQEKDLQIIKFKRVRDGFIIKGGSVVFSVIEISTLINYLANCIGKQRVEELLLLKEPYLKEKLATLKELGF